MHPLIDQLRFTRSEFARGLAGLTDEEARQRLLPANSISWNVGHLAWQEQRYFLRYAGGEVLFPEIDTVFAYRAPASTPPLDEVMTAWRAITVAADPWLDRVTSEGLLVLAVSKGREITSFGNLLLRTIYHYWYHNGENQAIRQQLGHTDLPQFVGDIDTEAPYRVE